VSPTYGTQDKEITGAMPSFEPTLTDAQIRQVAAFERSRYGGLALPAALTDCGLG
jgi:mono/diheme cytochrome c family protein